MVTRLRNIWEYVRTSFWFIPGLMVISAIVVSSVIVAIDKRVEFDVSGFFGIIYTGGPEGARSLLSTFASSMITIAGVAFSVVIVALTLASSQFGPRLLRNFMKDKGNQVVLGTFISTFIYCVMVLRSIHTLEEKSFVPAISVTFAMALALMNVVVLLYFIHHISASIQADQVVAEVYKDLFGYMKLQFPGELENESDEKEDNRSIPPKEDRYHQDHHLVVPHDGYLQAVDLESLLEIATKNDLLICLEYRPGNFIAHRNTLVTVKCNEGLDKTLSEKTLDSFIIGSQRSPEQDIEFTINQLVEVAVRALSPGINDPFTAMTCIDRLGSALCYLTGRSFPPIYHYDDQDQLRVMTRPVTFTDIIDAAFDQIRQYGRPSVAVIIRLLETLKTIAVHSRNSEQRQAILRQGRMIVRTDHASLSEENDRQDVQDRYKALLDALDENTFSPKGSSLTSAARTTIPS